MLVYQRITLKNATLCKWYFLQSTHRQPGIPPFPNSKWWLPWWRTSLKMSEWCGITEIGQWEHLLYSEQETPINLMAKKNTWFPVKIFPTKPIHWIRVPWLDMISRALIWGSEMFKTFSGNQGWSLRCTIINHRQESSTSSVANIHPTFNGAHSPCDFHLGQCGHRSKYPRKRLLQHKLENIFRPKSG